MTAIQRTATGKRIYEGTGQETMVNSLPVALASDQTNVAMAAGDSGSVDAFGRWRTSEPGNRFDIEFIYGKQPLLMDEVLTAPGTATHNVNSRDVTLAVVDAVSGTSAAMYSHFDIPYTPGDSQLIDMTGTLDGAGIGGGLAQLFVRTSVTGSTVTNTYDQTAWNGSTVSDVDWATSQILTMDFQSLKVGRIRFYMSRSGLDVKLHEVVNDNVRASGYWQAPSLPAYWRIYNDATYTYAEMGYGDTSNGIGIRYRIAVNASATMRAICATVKSEGGLPVEDMPGIPFSITNGITPITVSTTLVPVLSIRVASTFNSITNRGVYIPRGFSISGNNPMRYVLLYRPTLTGPSWTAVNATYSGMEYDVTATAVSGGIVINSDYFSTGRNSDAHAGGALGRIILSLGRTGTSDILTLAAVRTSTTNSTTYSSMQWREIR